MRNGENGVTATRIALEEGHADEAFALAEHTIADLLPVTPDSNTVQAALDIAIEAGAEVGADVDLITDLITARTAVMEVIESGLTPANRTAFRESAVRRDV